MLCNTIASLVGLDRVVVRMSLTSENGGGKETRTPDIKLAKLALYQLSYTPVGRPV